MKYGWDDDNIPYIEELSITYGQSDDNCGDPEKHTQSLTLESKDSGGGPFIRFSTGRLDSECKYWSVSDLSDLFEIFEDFLNKTGYDEKNYYWNCPTDKLLNRIYSKLEENGCRISEQDKQYVKENWSK